MIVFIKYNDIDKIKWDNCIDNSTNSIIYAYSWYLDIVTRKNWDAFVFDDYKAVMPLPSKSKFGVRYLYQPLFTQQLGVFGVNLSTELTNAFMKAVLKEFRFAEYNFNTHNDFQNRPDLFNKSLNLELNLKKSYSELTSSYSQNHKRNIKKAKDYGILISYSVGHEEVVQLFKNGKGNSLGVFNEQAYNTLDLLLLSLSEKNLITVIGAYAKETNELISGVIFIKDKNRQIFLFSGNNNYSKESGSMHLLVDSFIEQSCGYSEILDFEGSNNNNLARFYKGFGSEEEFYFSLQFNNLPFLTKRLLYFYKKLKNIIPSH